MVFLFLRLGLGKPAVASLRIDAADEKAPRLKAGLVFS
jgi:hypothetical protein